MVGCGRPIEFDEIGEKLFDDFLASLYTDTARARSIRMLSGYTWGKSRLPDRYKGAANRIDGLGWNEEEIYGLTYGGQEQFKSKYDYNDIGNKGLTKNAKAYFKDRLGNKRLETEKNIELLAAKASFEDDYDLAIDAYLHLGAYELSNQPEFSYNELPNGFLIAATFAQRTGQTDLAIDIFKGFLVHNEETIGSFLYGYTNCESALKEARSILGEDPFKKAGFDDKLQNYGSIYASLRDEG